jgi:hypothetical protein
MTSHHVSTRALAVLRAYGWHPERCVGVEAVADFLKSNGVELFPAAVDFLKEFGGLHLQLPDGGISAVKFDVHDEMSYFEGSELDQLRSLVKQSLCPIGVGGRFLLFLTPSEEMIFLHDEWLLLLLARNIHDGFEVICTPEFKDYKTIMLTEDQKPSAFRSSG